MSSYPLLGRTASRNKCLAAIQVFRHPETSGHALDWEVLGLSSAGQHGQRFVHLRHTLMPQ